MSDKSQFLKALESYDLINSVLTYNSFDKVNLNQLDYTKQWDNQYTFNNLQIGENHFKSVEIGITLGDIWISLLSTDTIYFDNALYFFGTEGISHEKEPYIIDNKEVKEYRRKLGYLTLFNRNARISILKSDAYGCIIKISFIN
jgi:hypothetical protein